MITDVVLVSKDHMIVNEKLEKWKIAHQGNELRISSNKAEFIKYNFRRYERESYKKNYALKRKRWKDLNILNLF